jgi:hypothetical protein
MSEQDDPVQSRATFLPVVLGTLVVIFICVALILLTGGLVFYVGCTVGLLVLLGLIHYVVWGKSMSDEVAAERQEMQMLERAREIKQQKWTFRR